MNKKALEVFNDLLEAWYYSELNLIDERSLDFDKDDAELERRKEEYQKRFRDAFNQELRP